MLCHPLSSLRASLKKLYNLLFCQHFFLHQEISSLFRPQDRRSATDNLWEGFRLE